MSNNSLPRYFILADHGSPAFDVRNVIDATDDIMSAFRAMMQARAHHSYHAPTRSSAFDIMAKRAIATAHHKMKLVRLWSISDEDELLFKIGSANGYKVWNCHKMDDLFPAFITDTDWYRLSDGDYDNIRNLYDDQYRYKPWEEATEAVFKIDYSQIVKSTFKFGNCSADQALFHKQGKPPAIPAASGTGCLTSP